MILQGDTTKGSGPIMIVLMTALIMDASLDRYPTPVAILLIVGWCLVPLSAAITNYFKARGKRYWGIYTLIFYVITGALSVLEARTGPDFSYFLFMYVCAYAPFLMIGYSLYRNSQLLKNAPKFREFMRDRFNVQYQNQGPYPEPSALEKNQDSD